MYILNTFINHLFSSPHHYYTLQHTLQLMNYNIIYTENAIYIPRSVCELV